MKASVEIDEALLSAATAAELTALRHRIAVLETENLELKNANFNQAYAAKIGAAAEGVVSKIQAALDELDEVKRWG